MTREEIKFYFAGKYVWLASRNAPLNYGLLDSYVAGALAAFDYLNQTTGGPEPAVRITHWGKPGKLDPEGKINLELLNHE